MTQRLPGGGSLEYQQLDSLAEFERGVLEPRQVIQLAEMRDMAQHPPFAMCIDRDGTRSTEFDMQLSWDRMICVPPWSPTWLYGGMLVKTAPPASPVCGFSMPQRRVTALTRGRPWSEETAWRSRLVRVSRALATYLSGTLDLDHIGPPGLPLTTLLFFLAASVVQAEPPRPAPDGWSLLLLDVPPVWLSIDDGQPMAPPPSWRQEA